MSGAVWTDSALDAARLRADPSADRLIEELFARGQVGGANALFAHLRVVGGAPGPEAPPALREWLERESTLPTWYDENLVLLGQKLFERLGVAAVMAMFNRALPQTYAVPSIAWVLAGSQRLTSDGARRVNETARLVLDVGAPGGFGPSGHGTRSCQQVRLVHAAVRHHLRAHPGAWNAAWGVPINQEDQAVTLQGFASSTLEALVTMGYDFTEHEARGYMHVWRVAGHFLGVEAELLPETFSGGLALAQQISGRLEAPTPEGVALTATLLDVQRGLIPGTFADGAVPVLLRWLVGARRADLLGVPSTALPGLLTGPFSWVNHLVDDVADESAVASAFLRRFNHALMHGVHEYYQREQPAALRIPESFLRG